MHRIVPLVVLVLAFVTALPEVVAPAGIDVLGPWLGSARADNACTAIDPETGEVVVHPENCAP